MKKSLITPKFYSLRIYLVAAGIFFMLVMPIAVIMLFKYGPYWMEDSMANANKDGVENVLLFKPNSGQTNTATKTETTEAGQNKTVVIEPDDLQFPQTFGLLLRMMLISIFLGFAWNYPFKVYFRRKRKNQQPSQRLEKFCRQWLLKIPHINALIVAFGFAVALTFMAFQVFGTTFKSSTTFEFFVQFFIISLLGAILTVIFVYFWFRHRVRFIYLEHVFDTVSLYRATENRYRDHIVRRLWINSLMTTLLPLTIVIFYLSLTKTSIQEVGAPQLNEDQIKVLFGKYVHIIEQSSLFQSEHLFYVNAIDSLLMFIGIFSGIFISIIYLFFFVNWTHYSIVIPLKEVVEKMRQPVETELDRLAILRTDDEIGELANGYNEMAMRITGNIRALSQITQANQRFVPVQFLEILDKESITDVNLGDQVQKIMTVLFVDIRSFTTLSEQLSPKENFDFLNEYLGFMEPVIRAHDGFVDKFIGDSIMALFHQSPEDAISAALEMRIQLGYFNELLVAAGKPAIETGAGIHTGNLMLGVVGGKGRMETTVISDAVNLASRLEGLTRSYPARIIISEATVKSLSPEHPFEIDFMDEVWVKGRTGSVKIFAVNGFRQNEAGMTQKESFADKRISQLKQAVLEHLVVFEKDFPYHDAAHTTDVFESVTRAAIYYQIDQQDLIVLQAAALLHETGMINGHENHEANSVKIARQILPQFNFDKNQIETICKLIMATKMPQQPDDLLSMILCDSDLDYLGRNDYHVISLKLRDEWVKHNGFGNDEEKWLKTQIQFLSQHSYFTDFMKQQRDQGKRENLKVIELQLANIKKQ